MKLNPLLSLIIATGLLTLQSLTVQANETEDSQQSTQNQTIQTLEQSSSPLHGEQGDFVDKGSLGGETIEAKVFFREGKLHFATKDESFHLWFDNRIYLNVAFYMPTESVDDLTSKANLSCKNEIIKRRV